MVTWSLWDPDRARKDWDLLAETASDVNAFQAFAWGEHKRARGWTPERWAAEDGAGRPAALLQVLVKRLPAGQALAWAPGGPLLGLPAGNPENAGESLESWLEARRREGPVAYTRFRPHLEHRPAAAYGLDRAFRRPFSRTSSGYTVEVDLSRPVGEILAGMPKKHRYELRRAEESGLEWRGGTRRDLAPELDRLHREMFRAKGLGRPPVDLAGLEGLGRAFGDKAVFLAGFREGRAVTACLALRCGARAFYIHAATGAEGRSISAAYGMVARLLVLLQEGGVRTLDLGGVDPASPSASGVDRFKLGFGGRLVEYLGEWEWAWAAPVRWAANAFLKARKAA